MTGVLGAEPGSFTASGAKALRVEEFANLIGSTVRGSIPRRWVDGEVTEMSVSSNGSRFFKLAGRDALIQMMAYANDRPRVDQALTIGARVVVFAQRTDYWAKSGRLVVLVDRAESVGEGQILREIAEIRARLQAEGLTDPARRRPLPMMPRRIGLITGRDSDALADVVAGVHERFSRARIALHPSLVQGVEAVDSLIAAMSRLMFEPGVDVIVIARGGGEAEALRPFSDERLCRAIVACRVPVVTAIGHTKDEANCDLVADASAAVPRAVGALVVPDERAIDATLDAFADRADRVRARIDGSIADVRLRSSWRLGERRLSAAVDAVRVRAHQVEGSSQVRRTLVLRSIHHAGAVLAGEVRTLRRRLPDERGETARMASGLALTTLRRFASRRERLGRRLLSQEASRRLGTDAARLATTFANVASRDGLRHGFVEVRDEVGGAIVSTVAARRCQSVTLTFRDGSVGARIDGADTRLEGA